MAFRDDVAGDERGAEVEVVGDDGDDSVDYVDNGEDGEEVGDTHGPLGGVHHHHGLLAPRNKTAVLRAVGK